MTPDTPNAINVAWWFNLTIFLGLTFYAIGVFSSLGHLMTRGPVQTVALALEKVSRYSAYLIFIAVHVMRLSHTGSVCSGDYLPDDARSDAVVQNYLIATGKFFMTYIIMGWIAVPTLLLIMVCVKGDKWAALALDAPK